MRRADARCPPRRAGRAPGAPPAVGPHSYRAPIDARLGTARRPGRHRRDRHRHDPFPAPGHLASWAGRGPPLEDKQPGARKGQRRHKRGNKYIGAVTGETAVAAGKTGTREGARHRRISRRRGKAKACVATGNTQLRVYHKLLSNPGMRFQDLGADWYDNQRQTAHRLSRLAGALDAMGYEVTLCRKPQPAGRIAPA